jgi:tetratricopeptide (TPR) repeat protein
MTTASDLQFAAIRDAIKANQVATVRQLSTIFIQDHPRDGRGLWSLGLAKMRLRDYEAAQDLFNEAAEAEENPLSYFNHTTLLADLDRRMGCGQLAKDGYSKVLAEAPYGSLAFIQSCAGMAELGYLETAVDGLRQSVAADPGHAHAAYFELGKLYAATDRYEAAVDAFERALSLTGSQAVADALADILSVVGRTSAYLEAHVAAKGKKPRKAPARRKRAVSTAAA